MAGNLSQLSTIFSPAVGTLIEAVGSTSLIKAGSDFYLSIAGSSVLLKNGGTAVVAGQLGPWVPVGAEASSSGYLVAWKIPATGQFAIWNTDGSGNFVSNYLNKVSGTDAALESSETLFHQDLNGDGVMGVPSASTTPPIVGTTIEASGSTSLVAVGENFLFNSMATGSGPTLKYGGVTVVPGQFGAWTPVAVEQTSIGYNVAWKILATGDFSVWTTDNNGNYISNLLNKVSGTDPALGSSETLFRQDLNGDGVIGVPSTSATPPIVGTTIEASGSTSLVAVGENFLFNSMATGSGPTLKYSGVAVVPGQFGAWTPVAVEQTSSGYNVAWKILATGDFSVWTADGNGNYISNLLNKVSPTDPSLKAVEATFYQDLNGDGVINTSSTVLNISGNVVS